MFMMKIKVYCIGKLKEKYFVDAQNEYLKRLERFAKVEVVEINDLPIPLNSSLKEEEIVKEKYIKKNAAVEIKIAFRIMTDSVKPMSMPS